MSELKQLKKLYTLFNYLFKLNYQHNKLPLNFEFHLAGDIGNEIKNRFGLGIGVRYQIQ